MTAYTGLMRLLATSLFALSVAASPRLAAAGACRPSTITAAPLAAEAAIAPDGGALIGWDDVAAADAPPLDKLDAWKFTAGTATVGTTRTVLAPGLVRFAPDAPATGALGLADDGGTLRVAVTPAATVPAPLAAPRASVRTRTFNRGRYGVGAETTARLVRIPDLAVAVVMYPAGEDVATGWARVGSAKTISLVATPGRCRQSPDGMLIPEPGTRVQLAWVDRLGRLSPRSKPIRVGR